MLYIVGACNYLRSNDYPSAKLVINLSQGNDYYDVSLLMNRADYFCKGLDVPSRL